MMDKDWRRSTGSSRLAAVPILRSALGVSGRRFALLGVAASSWMWLGGCGGTASPPPARAVIPAGRVGEPDPASVRHADPDLEVMRGLMEGGTPMGEHVDPRRGVLRIEIFSDASGEDARAGSDGIVRIAQRICGPELGSFADELQRNLKMRFSDRYHEPPFECDGDQCNYPAAMEFDCDGELRFAVDETMGTILTQIVRIEGATVTDEWAAAARVWVEEQIGRLGETRCSP